VAALTGGARRAETLNALAAEVPVISASSAPGRLTEARVPRCPRPTGNTRLFCIEVAGIFSPEILTRDLAAHFGKGADVWLENDRVYACTESMPEWPLLAGLLGDAPRGANLKLVTSDGFGFRAVQS